MIKILLPLFFLSLASCAHKVTRQEAIATANSYTQVRWIPQARHMRHGPDSRGIIVQTPDSTIASQLGWWTPNVTAFSMPYQWGGFDTPETFAEKISFGYKAGDIGDASKRKLGDAGVSHESCGIDCSGFVSRCWGLARPYSTRQLPEICVPIRWEELKAGDILLNNKHVVLFARWVVPGKELTAYEAGPFPVWKVSACGLYKDRLLRDGYSPWRYQHIVDSKEFDDATMPGINGKVILRE